MFGNSHAFSNYNIPLVVVNFIASGILYAKVEVSDVNNKFLKIKPNNCVAISQGRDCFADLEISWQLSQPKNVCLFELGVERPIKCWSKKHKGSYSVSFVAKIDTEFLLVNAASGEVLINEVMSVTWVYRESRKKRRWRVF
jgi:hypothetical protein